MSMTTTWLSKKNSQSSNKRHGEMHIIKKEEKRNHVRSNFLRIQTVFENGFQKITHSIFFYSIQYFDWRQSFLFQLGKKRKRMLHHRNTLHVHQLCLLSSIKSKKEQHFLFNLTCYAFILFKSLTQRKKLLLVVAVVVIHLCRYCQLNLIHASILLFFNAHWIHHWIVSSLSIALKSHFAREYNIFMWDWFYHIQFEISNEEKKNNWKKRWTQEKIAFEFRAYWVNWNIWHAIFVSVLLPVRARNSLFHWLFVCMIRVHQFLFCACCSDFYAWIW